MCFPARRSNKPSGQLKTPDSPSRWGGTRERKVGKYLLGLHYLHRRAKECCGYQGENPLKESWESQRHFFYVFQLQGSCYSHHSTAGPPTLHKPLKVVRSINHSYTGRVFFFSLPPSRSLFLPHMFRNSISIIRTGLGDVY